MNHKLHEVREELKSVLSGTTIDAILPPVVFAVVNGLAGLDVAAGVALILAVGLGGIRLVRKQAWQYALGGLAGVGLAAGLALVTRNAASYFLPAIIGSGLLFLLTFISLLIGKPLAAWVSHLTRGWPLVWFWRKDVKPAYREVTWAWTLFFAMRLILQVILYQQGEASTLAWANILLGWPVTIVVLVLSYLYGIWRLKYLGGPGVDEFESDAQPPWRGQTRGF